MLLLGITDQLEQDRILYSRRRIYSAVQKGAEGTEACPLCEASSCFGHGSPSPPRSRELPGLVGRGSFELLDLAVGF